MTTTKQKAIGEPWLKCPEETPHTGGNCCECRTCREPVKLPRAGGIPVPQAGSPTWPHVLAFAHAMEFKLSQNRRKGDATGWRKDGPAKLQDRLDDEIEELNAVLWDETAVDSHAVLLEAADVANFALMIADTVANKK